MEKLSFFSVDKTLLSRHPWAEAMISCLKIILTLALMVCLLLLWKQHWTAEGTLLIRISGESMNPTLTDGQILYAENLSDFSRQDLVCFTVPQAGEDAPGIQKGDRFIKRIIGLPGETVSIKSDGSIYVDGTYLWEPYVNTEDKAETYQGYSEDRITETTLSAHEYFVLGDNRHNSLDSRAFGPVSEDLIQASVSPSVTRLVILNFLWLILLAVCVPLIFYHFFGFAAEGISCALLRRQEPDVSAYQE